MFPSTMSLTPNENAFNGHTFDFVLLTGWRLGLPSHILMIKLGLLVVDFVVFGVVSIHGFDIAIMGWIMGWRR